MYCFAIVLRHLDGRIQLGSPANVQYSFLICLDQVLQCHTMTFGKVGGSVNVCHNVIPKQASYPEGAWQRDASKYECEFRANVFGAWDLLKLNIEAQLWSYCRECNGRVREASYLRSIPGLAGKLYLRPFCHLPPAPHVTLALLISRILKVQLWMMIFKWLWSLAKLYVYV